MEDTNNNKKRRTKRSKKHKKADKPKEPLQPYTYKYKDDISNFIYNLKHNDAEYDPTPPPGWEDAIHGNTMHDKVLQEPKEKVRPDSKRLITTLPMSNAHKGNNPLPKAPPISSQL